jgi:hypothetical protein
MIKLFAAQTKPNFNMSASRIQDAKRARTEKADQTLARGQIEIRCIIGRDVLRTSAINYTPDTYISKDATRRRCIDRK